MGNQIKVFWVEPQALVGAAMAELIRLQDGIVLVGSARTASPKVMNAISQSNPDVIVLAAELGDSSSVEFIKAAKKICRGARFLALGNSKDKFLFQRLLKVGCRGYLLKTALPSEVFDAIRAVASGASYISHEMITDLVEVVVAADNGRKRRDGNDISEREEMVLKLIASGYTSKIIAAHMGISPKTVDTYRTRVMAKLNLHSRAEVTRYCMQNNLCDFSIPIKENGSQGNRHLR